MKKLLLYLLISVAHVNSAFALNITTATGAVNGGITYSANQRTVVSTARGFTNQDRLDSKDPCGCFAPGTLVLTEAGLRPIETITVGDRVASMSEVTHDVSWKAIENIYRYQNREYFTLVLADGLNFAELTVTDDHPVWVANKGWIKTRDLQLGDQLQGQDGKLWDVIAWESQARHGETYNFEVEGYHTYFVGEDGLWVHNGGPCDHPTQSNDPERAVDDVTQNEPKLLTVSRGVGGNGAASDLGNLSSRSASEVSEQLQKAGFEGKSVAKSGYQRFNHADRSEVWVNWQTGRIVRNAAPKYGADGARINNGQWLDSNGAEVPRTVPHDQIIETIVP